MNCTCIDLHGKCLYDTGIIYRKKKPWVGGDEGGGGEGVGKWGVG